MLLLAPLPGAATGHTPAGADPGTVNLGAVACVSTVRCVAVGANDEQSGKVALITAATGAAMPWSGSTASVLNSIACPTAARCIAITADASARVTVATGATSIVTTLHAPTGEIVALGAIACPTAAGCFAVGFEGTELHAKALLAHFSATGANLGTTVTTSSTGFSSIACPTTTRCLLAAYNGSVETIRLLVNGHLGTAHAFPAKIFVQAIACYQAAICFAIGGHDSTERADLLYSINPTTGVVGSAATIAGTFSGNGLACSSASRCIVVGFTGPSKAAYDIVTNDHPAAVHATPYEGLADVACTTSGVCVGVGQNHNVGLAVTL
jgi:hypothetical protein